MVSYYRFFGIVSDVKTWSTPEKGQQLENLNQLANLDSHCKYQNKNSCESWKFWRSTNI